jgi:hypothetical protein
MGFPACSKNVKNYLFFGNLLLKEIENNGKIIFPASVKFGKKWVFQLLTFLENFGFFQLL